jgi:holliday junction DNA helicase RuvA
MIASLRGVVTEKLIDGSGVVLEVHGVGYGLYVTTNDFNTLIVGNEAKLSIHEHIREDTHDLFGFVQVDTKRLFEQLLSVKNVGPKVALAVLGIGKADTVRNAIASGDVKLLQTAKGVGKRAAEQMIVELRDKVGLVASNEAEGLVTRGGINLADEALQALMALGYSEVDAQAALQKIPADLPLEDRIKKALKG